MPDLKPKKKPAPPPPHLLERREARNKKEADRRRTVADACASGVQDNEYEEWLLAQAEASPGPAGADALREFAVRLMLGQPISRRARLHFGPRMLLAAQPGADIARALDLKKERGHPEGQTWRFPVAIVGELAQRAGYPITRSAARRQERYASSVNEIMGKARAQLQKAEREGNSLATTRAPRPLAESTARAIRKEEGAALKDEKSEHLERLAVFFGLGSIVASFPAAPDK